MRAVQRGLARLLHRETLPRRHAPCGPAGEHEGLEQGVARKAVPAVHPVAGGLAGGVKARHRGGGIAVDSHAAHEVMLRGDHGDRLVQNVAPLLQAMRPDVGEVRAHDLGVDGGEAQPLVLGALIAHLVLNGAGDHVPRLQLVGEALLGLVEQDGALPAACLLYTSRCV